MSKHDKNFPLIVNIGDYLQWLTKKHWISTRHRVLVPRAKVPRQILALFAAPNYDMAFQPPLKLRQDFECASETEKSFLNRKVNRWDFLTYYQWRKRRIKTVVKQLKQFKS